MATAVENRRRTEPAGDRRSETYGEGAEVPVVIDGREHGKIAVNEFLP